MTEKCKGQIYRARLSSYLREAGEYVITHKMAFLKRQSCEGCGECNRLHGIMSSMAVGHRIIPIQEMEHGALYTLTLKEDETIEFIKFRRAK